MSKYIYKQILIIGLIGAIVFRPELQNIRQRLLQQKLHIELKINSKLKNLKN